MPPKPGGAAGSVMAIPLNIQRGRPDTSGIKAPFNIADLDRKPEPIVQTPPVFPCELKQSVSEARARVGFIVTSRGDVIMPCVSNSSDRGFERATRKAEAKGKFKPGVRRGRKGNTRERQPLDFKVVANQQEGPADSRRRDYGTAKVPGGSSRHWPADRSPSSSGPKRARCSVRTSQPWLANMRRTW